MARSLCASRRRCLAAGAMALGLLSARGAAAQEGTSARQPVSVRFAAMVGDRPFRCGERYADIGVTGSSMTVSDFRYYVSDVRLRDASGREVAVQMTPDAAWQQSDVALLDFENGEATCANGTPELRDRVEGTVPAGTYTGLAFTVGVPFEKNHRDPTLQPSPLNLTRMFWNWNGGYKFMRIDTQSSGQPGGWSIHLGSTACTPRVGPTTVPTSCAFPNRVNVVLSTFNPASDVVTLDLRALLATSDIDAKTDESAGCMSGPRDAECRGLFGEFGLPFGESAGGLQRAFTARPAASVGRRAED